MQVFIGRSLCWLYLNRTDLIQFSTFKQQTTLQVNKVSQIITVHEISINHCTRYKGRYLLRCNAEKNIEHLVSPYEGFRLFFPMRRMQILPLLRGNSSHPIKKINNFSMKPLNHCQRKTILCSCIIYCFLISTDSNNPVHFSCRVPPEWANPIYSYRYWVHL